MKIVIISDTHGDHERLGRLSGDVLIHCGDFEDLFTANNHALGQVDDWFGRQNFDHVLCIGGNHDLMLEHSLATTPQPFRHARVLHESAVIINGVKFYGAPWVPQLKSHAFFADDAALKTAWAKIPADTDVLITHTPPAGVLDVSSRGQSLGCPHLAKRLQRLRPRLHCFGHIHASTGVVRRGRVTYVNASLFHRTETCFQVTLTDAPPKPRLI